jgi:hypothetical protein
LPSGIPSRNAIGLRLHEPCADENEFTRFTFWVPRVGRSRSTGSNGATHAPPAPGEFRAVLDAHTRDLGKKTSRVGGVKNLIGDSAAASVGQQVLRDTSLSFGVARSSESFPKASLDAHVALKRLHRLRH